MKPEFKSLAQQWLLKAGPQGTGKEYYDNNYNAVGITSKACTF